jgi:hypothetical protein
MPIDFTSNVLGDVDVPDKRILYPLSLAQSTQGRAEQVEAAILMYGVNAIIAKALPAPQQAIIGRFSTADQESFRQNQSYGLSVWPLPMTKLVENYFPSWYTDTASLVAIPLTQMIAVDTTTLGGTVTSGIIIAVATGYPIKSQTFTTTVSDTLATVIASISAICTTFGVTNTVNGTAITTRAPLTLRFGLPSTQWRESSRIVRHMQISVWSGVETLRSTIGDALENTIGTIATPKIDIGDGRTEAWVKYANSRRMDDDQLDSLWVYHLIVTAQYGLIETRVVKPILATSTSVNTTGTNSIISQS